MIGVVFEPPFDGGGVAAYRRFGERVGTTATAGLPFFAVKAGVAVAGDRPHVVESENGRLVGSYFRECEVA